MNGEEARRGIALFPVVKSVLLLDLGMFEQMVKARF